MHLSRSLKLAVGLALIAAVPATATTALPTVTRTLAASHSAKACSAAATDTTSYVAPMAGFVTFKLDAAGGQWNLYTADARTRRGTGRSLAFGSHQMVQTWATAGQRFFVSACRASGAVSQATVSIQLVDAAKPAHAVQSMVRTNKPVSRAMMTTLEQLGFDASESAYAGHTDILVPSAGKVAQLRKLGLEFKTTVPNLQAFDRKMLAADAQRAKLGLAGGVPSGRTTYRYLSEIQAEMADIVAKHSSIARPVTIGTSYQGRPIQGVELSHDVAAKDDGKPTFFLVATHHAREWPAAETAMEFLNLLAKNDGLATGDGPTVSNLLDKERIVIVPVVNVDGYFASRGDWAGRTATNTAIPDPSDAAGLYDSGEEPLIGGGALAYRRKNCDTASQALPAQSDAVTQLLPCYWQLGVDNNRNYGFDWGGPGASTDPTTQVYRGTGQWSEPESAAVWHYSQTHPVTVLITLHTVAAKVLRSPGLAANGLAPDEKLLKQLGDKMANNSGYVSQYGWELYDTTGTTEDWNYGAVGTLGYTIEIGDANGRFHDAYQQGVIDQWNGPKASGPVTGGGMRASLLTAADYAQRQNTHVTLSGTGPAGAELELKKTFITDSSKICTFAQGYLSGNGTPGGCVAPGTVFDQTHAADMLDYTTQVRPDGTFTWHVTQSTRPFKGYKYNSANSITKGPDPTGVKEYWTLTCKVGGAVKKTTGNIFVERGQTVDLGDVCS